MTELERLNRITETVVGMERFEDFDSVLFCCEVRKQAHNRESSGGSAIRARNS
jgi:hypothetical protein